MPDEVGTEDTVVTFRLELVGMTGPDETVETGPWLDGGIEKVVGPPVEDVEVVVTADDAF